MKKLLFRIRVGIVVAALFFTVSCCGNCLVTHKIPNARYSVGYTCGNESIRVRVVRTDRNGVLLIPNCDQIHIVTFVGF